MLTFYDFTVSHWGSGVSLYICNGLYIFGIVICLCLSLELLKKKSFGKPLVFTSLLLAVMGSTLVTVLLKVLTQVLK